MDNLTELYFGIQVKNPNTGKTYTQKFAGAIPIEYKEDEDYLFKLDNANNPDNSLLVIRAYNNLLATIYKSLDPTFDVDKYREFKRTTEKEMIKYFNQYQQTNN